MLDGREKWRKVREKGCRILYVESSEVIMWKPMGSEYMSHMGERTFQTEKDQA